VRLQLAAYRRDDWSTGDLTRLADHLASCADCRRLEASYRAAGEKLRQLPSITPPPDFRDRVFAAIRADQQRISPEIARASREATNPALPVVRPTPIARRRRLVVNPRAVLAIAAVVLLTLATARILPAAGLATLGRTATSLTTLRLAGPVRPHVTTYALDSRYTIASSAMATGTWLVYSGTDAAHGSMLFAENRRTRASGPLLAVPSLLPITVRALSDRWAVWTAGAGAASAGWSLHASALPASGTPGTSPLMLLASANAVDPAPVTLGGVWAGGDTVLVAGATASGYGVLLRYDLSRGAPLATTLVRTAAAGHVLTDPSSDGNATYWADVWYDGSVLHSTIWWLANGGRPQPISGDDAAFHPTASDGTLVWVDVAPTALGRVIPVSGEAPADADEELVNSLNGGLQARNLASGRQWQISPRADVSGVQRGGLLLVWHSDSQTHVYDLRAQAPAEVDPQVRTATLAAATSSAVVWELATAAPLSVYDAP
jgi:negative regulator of sigma E activity